MWYKKEKYDKYCEYIEDLYTSNNFAYNEEYRGFTPQEINDIFFATLFRMFDKQIKVDISRYNQLTFLYKERSYIDKPLYA